MSHKKFTLNSWDISSSYLKFELSIWLNQEVSNEEDLKNLLEEDLQHSNISLGTGLRLIQAKLKKDLIKTDWVIDIWKGPFKVDGKGGEGRGERKELAMQ